MGKTSMFDEHKEDIVRLAKAERTYREILERLGPGYSYASLFGYCKRLNLRIASKSEVLPRCDECEECYRYRTCNDYHGRICKKVDRQIPATTKVSPIWCGKR